MTLWQGKASKKISEFTAGKDAMLDEQLVESDCIASIAHARTLCKAGFLTKEEQKQLEEKLTEIAVLAKKGEFNITLEDCHTAIEEYLVKELGDTGKKVHAGRSRNDQVLAALRLYAKKKLVETKKGLLGLALALTDKAIQNNYAMPGYTHMRPAMPSSTGLWLSSFAESLLDDLQCLASAYHLLDQSPLGSAAGFGSTIPLDREYTAMQAGFKKVQHNVLYVQNSRGKTELAVIAALHQVMLTLSKLATDLLLYSTREYGFVSFPDELCTGSSMMPQKRNADGLELVRAKTQDLLAAYVKVAATVSSLPSGYNRDLQETKKPLMDSFDTTLACLEVVKLYVEGMTFDEKRMLDAIPAEAFAADAANELVKQGVPFREAYVEVKGSLGALSGGDVQENLASKKSLGMPGNLGLASLRKEIESLLQSSNGFK